MYSNNMILRIIINTSRVYYAMTSYIFGFIQILTLNFLDPPEVKEEQSIVFTVEGQETEIVCIVHAEPKADVS